MRALLLEILRYQLRTGSKAKQILPLFQMASIYNYQELEDAYEKLGDSPYLRDLMAETGVAINKEVLTGVQPMLAAYTHSSLGRPKEVFATAYGKPNNPLPMPGGHGQNFQILSRCYRELFDRGIKMVYLGNVDNLGFTVNPVAVALLALQGKTGGFEFAFRTVVDTKGSARSGSRWPVELCRFRGGDFARRGVGRGERGSRSSSTARPASLTWNTW